MNFECSCGVHFKKFELWVLKDIKDFTERKLAVGNCPQCHHIQLVLIEKRISDGKIFTSYIPNKNTCNVLAREQKRLVCRYYNIDNNSLNGWVYGVNIEIKNKQGKVTQIRQYASDFNGNKTILKKMKI